MNLNLKYGFLLVCTFMNINHSSAALSVFTDNSVNRISNVSLSQDTLNYYLCCYFPNSSEKKMYYATSIDGYNFKAVPNNPILIDTVIMPNMVLTGNQQDQVMRDPMILRDQTGKFRLIATYSWKKSPMVTFESTNLKDWTNGRLIYPTDPTYYQTWAPQLEYDALTKQYLVYWTGCLKGVWSTLDIVYMTSPDFVNWSSVKKLNTPGMDASMFSANGKHYLVYRGNGTRQVASVGSILGPYNTNSHLISQDDIEGPFVYKIANQNVWILFGDLYQTGGSYKLYKSTDGENWTVLNTSEYYFPTGVDAVRHGSVMAISKAEYTLLSGTVPNLDPLTGVQIIDGVGTAPNTYATIRTAIIDLNARGVGAGGVTFQIPAGYTYMANSPKENLPAIKIDGSADSPILFQKSGSGVNPKIIGYGDNTILDGAITISGGDYITFDGIDVVGDVNTEYGYYLVNVPNLQDATIINGAQNNTIKNCKITLNRSNFNGSIGICQNAVILAKNQAGTNSNNAYYNFTIENTTIGLSLVCAANATYTDKNNIIGVLPSGISTIGAYTVNDIMGAIPRGVQLIGQEAFSISNLDIRNIACSGSTPVMGIFISGLYGTNNRICNNTIHDLYALSTGSIYGIRIDGGNTATCDIYNNVIYNTACCIYLNAPNNYNVYFNSARLALSGTASGSILKAIAGITINAKNNNFSNLSTSTRLTYIYMLASPATVTSNYNNLYVNNANKNAKLSIFGTSSTSTLTVWQNATTSGNSIANDLNSFSTDPNFTSQTDLKPITGKSLMGTYIAGISTDITGIARNVNPIIGAYESNSASLLTNPFDAMFYIYPNQVLNEIFVNHQVAETNSYLQIVGLNGKIISTYIVEQSSKISKIDLSKLPNGSYILQFNNNGVKSVLKFVK